MAVCYNDARSTVALQVQISDEVCLCSAIYENHSLSLQHSAHQSNASTGKAANDNCRIHTQGPPTSRLLLLHQQNAHL